MRSALFFLAEDNCRQDYNKPNPQTPGQKPGFRSSFHCSPCDSEHVLPLSQLLSSSLQTQGWARKYFWFLQDIL